MHTAYRLQWFSWQKFGDRVIHCACLRKGKGREEGEKMSKPVEHNRFTKVAWDDHPNLMLAHWLWLWLWKPNMQHNFLLTWNFVQMIYSTWYSLWHGLVCRSLPKPDSLLGYLGVSIVIVPLFHPCRWIIFNQATFFWAERNWKDLTWNNLENVVHCVVLWRLTKSQQPFPLSNLCLNHSPLVALGTSRPSEP